MFYRTLLLSLFVIGGLTACASTTDDPPVKTDDGLERVSGTRVDAAYLAPGADFGQYEVLYIREVEVSFVAHWLRDTNRNRVALSERLSQEDADQIKLAVADSFQAVFTQKLQEAGYTVLADKSSAGPEDDILVLVPAIVDLDVAAPDTRSPGRTRTYNTSAGSMTLQMEMYDGLSSALLGRVIDDQEARDYGTVRVANSVTNKAEAERIFRKWADLLVKGLDEAHGK